ncbi:MAG TPA: polyprenyl diphosphate synthase [Candidatus Saccharimonadales bacterium]|nr:polyprenyl diphosphate synthase [Candidatus Saccharimonadales bacterium]
MPETIEIPRHVGIILDGNRRWAEQKGLPVRKGHEAGYQNIREIARSALDMGVEYLSVYGFSTANWKRTEREVGHLMRLFKKALTKDIGEVDEENIRLRFCGSEEGLDRGLLKALKDAEERTADNTRGQVVLCLNYSGRQEVVEAVKSVLSSGLGPDEVDQESFARYLYVPDLPDMDLLIRTSGERRVSDFMPYRASDAEFVVSEKLWPDFTPDDFAACIEDYAQRDRRLGA